MYGQKLARPLRQWMTEQGLYNGYELVRMNAWRDLDGAQYGEDYFIYSTAPITVTPGQSQVASVQVESDSGFEWLATTFAAVSSGVPTSFTSGGTNISALITDGGSSRNLSNIPVPVPLWTGPGTFLQYLPVPRRFQKASNIQIVLQNFDSALTYSNVQLLLIGRKIFSESQGNVMGRMMKQFRTWEGLDGRQYCEDLYTYAFNVQTLPTAAAAPVTTANLLIDADSDFEWILTAQSAQRNALTGASVNNLLYSAQIIDQASGRQLFLNSSNALGIAGSGGQIYVNPVPRVFMGKSPVQLQLTNLDTVALNNLFFAMIGRKIFKLD